MTINTIVGLNGDILINNLFRDGIRVKYDCEFTKTADVLLRSEIFTKSFTSSVQPNISLIVHAISLVILDNKR